MQMPETTGTILATKAGLFAGTVTLFAYTGVNSEAFSILGVLMLIDMVTGISKQYRIEPQLITSHRWWLGLVKKVYTLIGILSLGLAIRGVGFDPTVFISCVIPGYIAAEIYSVIQNIYIFSTGEKVTEFNATSFVFRTILSVVKKTLEVWAKKFLNDSSIGNTHEQSGYMKNEVSSKE